MKARRSNGFQSLLLAGGVLACSGSESDDGAANEQTTSTQPGAMSAANTPTSGLPPLPGQQEPDNGGGFELPPLPPPPPQPTAPALPDAPETNPEGIPINGQSSCALPAGDTPPGRLLDLDDWGLNIPFNDDGNDGNGRNSQWITDLDNYQLDFYYESNGCNNGVIFRAHAGGATTGGSDFPRSELRERPDGGDWSSSSGRHEMRILQSINNLPVYKSHVVAGQIHGEDDDITVVRLEGRKLWVTQGDSKLGDPLDEFYYLGSLFEIRFVVEDDVTQVFYNPSPGVSGVVPQMVELRQAYDDAYFKAGCYTQSACAGDRATPNEACDAFGEVEIFELEVSHSD